MQQLFPFPLYFNFTSCDPNVKNRFPCRFIAIGCSDKLHYSVRVFDSASHSLVATLAGHHDIIYDLGWSSDDTMIASASADATARVWHLKSKTNIVLHHPAYVYSVAFHPVQDKGVTLLATGCFDGIVRIWDSTTGTCFRELRGHRSHVNTVCFNQEGSKLFSGDGAGVIKGWNGRIVDLSLDTAFELFKTIADPELAGEAIITLRVHPNNRRLLVHSQDSVIRLLDLRLYNVTMRFAGASASTFPVKSRISPDGR